MRLIDDDGLCERLNYEPWEHNADRDEIALPIVNADPTVDAVPVVRCKDCRWRGIEECAMFYRCECGEQHTWETDNDFCSYGERKEGAE